MGIIDRDGVDIYYEVHGPSDTVNSDQPGRAPLLLTHGFSSSADMWNVNLPALTQDRYVITWDIRGHGRSASPVDQDQYTEALSVDDMEAILKTVGATKAVIGGLSLGGYLSLAFNLAHSEMVLGLILCDTGPGYRNEKARENWNQMAIRWAEQFESEGLTALGSSGEVKAAVHSDALGLARAARGILIQHDSRVIDSLSQISVPTLVVVGSEDKPFIAASDMMVSKIPGAELAEIRMAGHAANIDQPTLFDRAVGAFLDRI